MKIGNSIVDVFSPFSCLKNDRQKAAKRNQETFLDYWLRLEEIAINVFIWKGLPDTIDPRFLELTLFEQGQILFFKDDYLGFLALPFVGGHPLDVYGIPVSRHAYSWNGYQFEGNIDNSVICWNNFLHTPGAPTVVLFASRLADIERSIEVNARSQKTPIAVLCEEHERLSYVNAYKDYDGNLPVVFGSKSMDLKNITTINTQAPFVGLDLQVLKKQIWNECLTYIGINNSASEKRERQVATEAIASQGAVEANRYVKLHSRQLAAEQINKMFGLKVTVEINENLTPFYDNLEAEIVAEEGN